MWRYPVGLSGGRSECQLDEDVFFAELRFAGDFFAVPDAVLVFLAGDEVLADAVLAVVFFAAVFLAVPDAVLVFLAGDEVLADAVLAVVFFAAVFLAVPDAVLVFLAGDEVLADAVFAAVFFAVVLEAVEVPPDALDAAAFDVDCFAVPEDVVAAVATFGIFLAPETTALRLAPGRNFGTAVFFARVRSPVRGLRTIRAGRTAFSNAPNPVMATFSPFATSRVMVLTTDSRACLADDLLPSN